jgi:hypothetical protein
MLHPEAFEVAFEPYADLLKHIAVHSVINEGVCLPNLSRMRLLGSEPNVRSGTPRNA